MEGFWVLVVVIGLGFWAKSIYEDKMKGFQAGPYVRYQTGQKPSLVPRTLDAGQLPPPNTDLPPPTAQAPTKTVFPASPQTQESFSRTRSTSSSPAYSRVHESDYEVSKKGFQPNDRCSCGGTWVKRVNTNNGGRFFSCSRYPKCTNKRDEVLKRRLGIRYRDFYCTEGHELEVFGTTTDPRSGKEVCNRCIDKGYRQRPRSLQLPSEKQIPRDLSTTSNSGSKNNSSNEYCKNGHRRTIENTYYRPDGSRECRICRRNAR